MVDVKRVVVKRVDGDSRIELAISKYVTEGFGIDF